MTVKPTPRTIIMKVLAYVLDDRGVSSGDVRSAFSELMEALHRAGYAIVPRD